MQTVPTVTDIFDFAKQIGVPLPNWLRNTEDWSTVLHELAHWAVKPHGYVRQYVEMLKPYGDAMPLSSTPCAEMVLRWKAPPLVRWPDGQQAYLRHDHICNHLLDPTPNEFGARAWGIQVLSKLGWRHPMDCPELMDEMRLKFGMAQFDSNELFGAAEPYNEPHPISAYGPDQLAFMGIDVANGVFRPQVELDFDGQWLRVRREETVIWEHDVFAGLALLGWGEPEPELTDCEPILLEDLLAIAQQASQA